MLARKFEGVVYGNLSVKGIREVFEAHSNIDEWAFVLHDQVPNVQRHYHVYVSLSEPERSSSVNAWFENAVAKMEPLRGDVGAVIRYYARSFGGYTSTGIVVNFSLKKYLE